MAAPTPQSTTGGNADFHQQTSCTADTWTDLVKDIGVFSGKIEVPMTWAFSIVYASFQNTNTSRDDVINFGFRIVNTNLADGAAGYELILAYEESVYSGMEQMSDENVQAPSKKVFDFSNIVWRNGYKLQYYSTATSGFIVNAVVSDKVMKITNA
tara:strand:- start:60 stop:524 length:465 start_codon:yes stop_codon:yes gene_type:complete